MGFCGLPVWMVSQPNWFFGFPEKVISVSEIVFAVSGMGFFGFRKWVLSVFRFLSLGQMVFSVFSVIASAQWVLSVFPVNSVSAN